METIKLNFEGYWLDIYKDELPHESGIYCVYACESMAANKIVVLRELIYVGATDDIAESVVNHSEAVEWKAQLERGESLCYSFARVNRDICSRVRAGIVCHHQPSCNRDGEFGFEDTRLTIAGDHALLDNSFIVSKKNSDLASIKE